MSSPCGENRFVYVIAEDDYTPQHIADKYDVSVDSINASPRLDAFGLETFAPWQPGQTLCLPIQIEVEEEQPIEQPTVEPEQDVSEIEALYRSGNVPDYLLKTKVDVLRYYWVVGMNRSLADFDSDNTGFLADVERNFRSSIETALAAMSRDAQVNGITNPLYGDEKANVNFDDVPVTIVLDEFADLAIDYAASQGAENFSFAPISPNDEGYQADLALEDFLSRKGPDDPILRALADMIIQASMENISLRGMHAFDAESSHSEIIEALINQLGGENYTPDDLNNLVNLYTQEYYEHQDDPILNRDPLNGGSYAAQFATSALTQSNAQNAQYLDAVALDSLRAVAFDPSWNPDQEAAQLAELNGAISTLEGKSVIGIDISWVAATFRQYYNERVLYREWRLKLRDDMMNVEVAMLNRQDDGDPLWWVGMVAETLLNFVDVLEPLFILRDAMHGDWFGVALGVGDLALGPLLDGITAIRRASRYVDNGNELIIDLGERTRQLPKKIVPPNRISSLEWDDLSTRSRQILDKWFRETKNEPNTRWVLPLSESKGIRMSDLRELTDYTRNEWIITQSIRDGSLYIGTANDPYRSFIRGQEIGIIHTHPEYNALQPSTRLGGDIPSKVTTHPELIVDLSGKFIYWDKTGIIDTPNVTPIRGNDNDIRIIGYDLDFILQHLNQK